MKTNPAMLIALVGALMTLLLAFGIVMTEGQVQAVMGFATIVIPILIGIVTRSQVYSPASAQSLLNMPSGMSMGMADRALAASVTVSPGDTKTQVINKVNAAEGAKE